jgi:phospholipase C
MAPHPGIEKIFVLALENRSFDHVFANSGLDHTGLPQPVADLIPDPLPYLEDRILFDPPHEFIDVFLQRQAWDQALNAYDPRAWIKAVQTGFEAANRPCGPYDSIARPLNRYQIGVIRTLAQQYGFCTSWRSSLPSSTWPNRFFFHAASCGGCYDGPNDARVIASLISGGSGFDFQGRTVFERMTDAPAAIGRKNWKIFYGGGLLPQVFSLKSMTLGLWWTNYFHLGNFQKEVAKDGYDAAYTFIEPNYDLLNSYKDGNSQHPCGSVAAGEALIRYVYESIRNSPHWEKSLLIITYDEHGGFYDHVGVRNDFIPPDVPVPTTYQYQQTLSDTYNKGISDRIRPPAAVANAPATFDYTTSGFRVPALVISPYIRPGTIIHDELEHSCIPATVLYQFGLGNLTQRDATATPLTAYLEQDVVQATEQKDNWQFPDDAMRGDDDYDPPSERPSLTSTPTAQQRTMALLRLQLNNGNQSDSQLKLLTDEIMQARTLAEIQGVLSDLRPLHVDAEGNTHDNHVPPP